MERHDTMIRAACCVAGAGTLAIAMLIAAAQPATAQTTACFAGGEGDPTVCGHVFTDRDGGGTFDEGEGEPNVVVAITDALGNNVGNSPTPSGDCADVQSCGYYAFSVYEPGDYWVCLVPDPTHADCHDTAAHPESQPITVGPNGQIVDFPLGSGTGEEPLPDVWGVGTGTPGYWKNHPEAWPSEGVMVGGVLYKGVTISTAIKLMGKVGGDKTLTMFASLISAKLNSILANNTACIKDTIGKADTWMTQHPVANPAVKASSPAWVEGEPWHQRMDDYNNGKLCAPHRD